MEISLLHKRRIETVAYRSARARCGGHGIVGSFIAGGDKLIRLNALDLATGHCKRKLGSSSAGVVPQSHPALCTFGCYVT